MSNHQKFFTLFIALAFVSFSSLVSAKPSKDPEDCALSDLVIEDGSSDPSAVVIGCAGQLEGNDGTSLNWLSSQTIWDDNGVLTNDLPASVTDDTWVYLAKYDEDSGLIELGSAGWSGNISFSNCYDKHGNSTSCSSGWSLSDVTFSIDPLLYDQFVITSKASNYYSLYQVELLKSVTTLTGTLSMITKHALSHFTLWARTTTDPSTSTVVSGPSTVGLMLIAGALMVFRARRHKREAKAR